MACTSELPDQEQKASTETRVDHYRLLRENDYHNEGDCFTTNARCVTRGRAFKNLLQRTELGLGR